MDIFEVLLSPNNERTHSAIKGPIDDNFYALTSKDPCVPKVGQLQLQLSK